MSYGTQLKFGIARQANAGSWATLPTSYHGIALTQEAVGYEAKELISANLIGRFDQGASYQGTSTVNGTIDFELTPRNLAAMIAATMNNSASQVTSGSLQTWVFFPTTADYSATLVQDPWTIYKQWSDAASAELFYDCQFSQLDLIFAQGQFVKGKTTITMGTRLANGIGSMAVLPDAGDVGQLFPWNVASLSYAGAALSNFSDFQVSFNENIDALYTMNGTLAPFKATRKGFREITVNGTFYFSDRVLLNNFVANVQGRLLATIVNTKTSVQSGYYNSLQIDVPQLKLTAVKPGTSGPGEVSVKFTGRGIIDPSSAYSIALTLTNTWGGIY